MRTHMHRQRSSPTDLPWDHRAERPLPLDGACGRHLATGRIHNRAVRDDGIPADDDVTASVRQGKQRLGAWDAHTSTG